LKNTAEYPEQTGSGGFFGQSVIAGEVQNHTVSPQEEKNTDFSGKEEDDDDDSDIQWLTNHMREDNTE